MPNLSSEERRRRRRKLLRATRPRTTRADATQVQTLPFGSGDPARLTGLLGPRVTGAQHIPGIPTGILGTLTAGVRAQDEEGFGRGDRPRPEVDPVTGTVKNFGDIFAFEEAARKKDMELAKQSLMQIIRQEILRQGVDESEALEALFSLDKEKLEQTPGTLLPDLVVSFFNVPGAFQALRDVASDFIAGDVNLGTGLAAAGAVPIVGPVIKTTRGVQNAARRIERAANIADVTTDTQRAAMRATARARGSVGNRPTRTTQAALERLRQEESVLDFGAGPAARQSDILREQGFANVTATDLPESIEASGGRLRALESGEQFDTVLASNVLNVQPSREALGATIGEISNRVRTGGRAIVNFPKTPRKSDVTPEELEQLLQERFNNVERIGGTKSDPVFEIRNPRPTAEQGLGRGGVEGLQELTTEQARALTPEQLADVRGRGVGAPDRPASKAPSILEERLATGRTGIAEGEKPEDLAARLLARVYETGGEMTEETLRGAGKELGIEVDQKLINKALDPTLDKNGVPKGEWPKILKETVDSRLPALQNLQAQLQEGRSGAEWYNDVLEDFVREFGEEDGRMFTRFFAVTSQRARFGREIKKDNIDFARRAFAEWKAGEEFGTRGPFGLANSQIINNLKRVSRGEPPQGPKIRPFHDALLGDPDAVVIDSWMMKAFGFENQAPTPAQRRFMENVIRNDAARYSLPPREYQAAVWEAALQRDPGRMAAFKRDQALMRGEKPFPGPILRQRIEERGGLAQWLQSDVGVIDQRVLGSLAAAGAAGAAGGTAAAVAVLRRERGRETPEDLRILPVAEEVGAPRIASPGVSPPTPTPTIPEGLFGPPGPQGAPAPSPLELAPRGILPVGPPPAGGFDLNARGLLGLPAGALRGRTRPRPLPDGVLGFR